MLKPLLYDFVMFALTLLYVPFIFMILLPLKYLDKLLGTRLFSYAIRFTKMLGNM